MTAQALLQFYRLVLVALLLVASVITLIGPEHEATVLAGVEIAGVLMFAWRPSQLAGGAVLLGVFALAEILSINHGRLATQFLQYAAAVIFVIAMDRQFAKPAQESLAT